MTAFLKNKLNKTEKEIEKPEVKEKKPPVELKTLLKWQAPMRPFKKRDKDYYSTIAAIVFLLAVILLFLKEWLLIAVMVALTFVTYVLATVKPENVTHEITTRGVVTGGKAYNWEELERFWFSKKWNDTILHISTTMKFPTSLMMLLSGQTENKIKEVLKKRVQLESPDETFMDRSAQWLQKKVPLEKE